MNSTLPPQVWRSEAFAEDLFDDHTDTSGLAAERGGATLLMLWGLLPVVVAAAGAVVMTWSGA